LWFRELNESFKGEKFELDVWRSWRQLAENAGEDVEEVMSEVLRHFRDV
jgi:hypothetical protein